MADMFEVLGCQTWPTTPDPGEFCGGCKPWITIPRSSAVRPDSYRHCRSPTPRQFVTPWRARRFVPSYVEASTPTRRAGVMGDGLRYRWFDRPADRHPPVRHRSFPAGRRRPDHTAGADVVLVDFLVVSNYGVRSCRGAVDPNAGLVQPEVPRPRRSSTCRPGPGTTSCVPTPIPRSATWRRSTEAGSGSRRRADFPIAAHRFGDDITGYRTSSASTPSGPSRHSHMSKKGSRGLEQPGRLTMDVDAPARTRRGDLPDRRRCGSSRYGRQPGLGRPRLAYRGLGRQRQLVPGISDPTVTVPMGMMAISACPSARRRRPRL